MSSGDITQVPRLSLSLHHYRTIRDSIKPRKFSLYETDL